ncbi:hypothetical protein [Mesorhizobium sp. SP-1A]|uniref:hypothetical protein n=1 Tax=Mesorhizobium sp. SP-1A TaxID=3077840 RepID=UPI0028F71B44|nr:hypothetical protein [Mesorhizobium sp. SP-1A]
MQNATIQDTQSERKFDLADLVSSLVSLNSPNRAVDQVVEVMLGGDTARAEIAPISVLGNKWLYSETPYYTRDMKSVEGLAARRGVTFSTERATTGFSATASMPKTGQHRTASSPLATAAAIAAIASLSYGV